MRFLRAGKLLNRDLVAGGVLVLTNLLLLGVGFSTWQVGTDITTEPRLSAKADNAANLMTFVSRTGGVSFSKLGFIDSDDKITDSYTFSYSFSFDQDLARSIGYISADKITFNARLSAYNDSSKFFVLLKNGYVTVSIGSTYNAITISAVEMINYTDYASASIEILNPTESAKETIGVDLTMNYVSAKSAEIQPYFDSIPPTSDFSFKLNIEAVKSV